MLSKVSVKMIDTFPKSWGGIDIISNICHIDSIERSLRDFSKGAHAPPSRECSIQCRMQQKQH